MTAFAEFLMLFGFIFVLKFVKNDLFFPEKKYTKYDLLAGIFFSSVGLYIYGDYTCDICILITACVGLWMTAILIDQIYRSDSTRKEIDEDEA